MRQFSILGPLEVSLDGRLLDLGGIRQRAVLAVLLLREGEVVRAPVHLSLLLRVATRFSRPA